ncbi:baseplate J/gp47 family protein [Breoghania sp.]|uniref:baseplate assembly protein n=1 Tax=Breoghania sp. TaxID=2065378 RepID=UPI002AA82428|nr:baseplate J/gp47 family protein [Breoghania sp.]
MTVTATTTSYFRLIDLSGVPAPDFVEQKTCEEIRADNIAFLVGLDPAFSAFVESDPAIKAIEAFSYREFLLRQHINDVARANTITGALGNDLVVKGAGLNVEPLDGEGDEAFRERVHMALALLGAAGPLEAYRAHAREVSADVINVLPISSAAGEVVVTVFGVETVTDATADEIRIGAALFAQPPDGNKIVARRSGSVLAAVKERLNGEDVQPMTDVVTVRPPTIVEYAIDAELTVYAGPDQSAILSEANSRLASYLRSVRKVGYDATRVGIAAALAAPGVQNVILTSPAADVVADDYSMTAATSVRVVIGNVGL